MDERDEDSIELLNLSQQLLELNDPLEHESRERKRKLRHVPLLILLFVFVAGLGDAVQSIPLLQVWRFFICQKIESRYNLESYSPGANQFAESASCQRDEISRSVATFDGWLNAIGMMLAVITGLLYGRLSDIRGRIPILKFCAWGSLLSQIVILVALWFWQSTNIAGVIMAELILGISGGGPVLVSTCYALLSDVLEESTRLAWFARCVGVWYASRIIGPPIGSWLLSYQLLAPIFFSTILFGLSVPVLYFIPETSNNKFEFRKTRIEYVKEMKTAVASMAICVHNRNLTIISFASMSYYFGVQIISVLTIFVSATYGWSIVSAGYLSSYQACLKFGVALLIIPHVQALAKTIWTTCDRKIDLYVAQISFLIDALSWILVAILPASGLLPSLCLGTLGIAASSSLRSLAVAEVSAENHGQLFACLGVIDALGAAIASPALAYVYGSTMKSAPETVFLFVAVVFASSCVLFHWFELAEDPQRLIGHHSM